MEKIAEKALEGTLSREAVGGSPVTGENLQAFFYNHIDP